MDAIPSSILFLGSMMVKDINPGETVSFVAWLTPIGDTLYFQAWDDASGYQL